MKIGVVIPWRETPTRLPAFEVTRDWYKNNLPEATIYYADRESPVWLMSATRNDGVKKAEADGCDVIVMSDADTFPQIGPLREAILAAYEDELLHLPYTDYRMLGTLGTNSFFAGTPIDKCSYKSYPKACSGVNVFKPSTWWAIGGNDEKFKQWGYEDTAMRLAHEVILGQSYIRHNGVAYNLGHDPQPRVGTNFDNNRILFGEYEKTKDAVAMLALVKRETLLPPIQRREMNILAFATLYLPGTKAGAEMMLHQMLLELKERGYNVKVVCDKQDIAEVDGIDLVDNGDNFAVDAATRWADVVFTHLGGTRLATRLSNTHRKPLVHIIHNDSQAKAWKISPATADLLVINSEWIKAKDTTKVPSIVVNPPANPKDYATTFGDAITLINLSKDKGAEMFYQLARIFPDRKFIGVEGGYDDQIIKELENVTLIKNTSDIKSVYAKTGILLMPSAYESWGRVGLEAAASGIPVIATPTPGILESLGETALFVEHGDVAGYVEAIRLLDDEKNYKIYSKAAKARAKDAYTAFLEQMETLERNILAIRFGVPGRRPRG
jgi:glycosyltransferase involved in cell wall biosynthesis